MKNVLTIFLVSTLMLASLYSQPTNSIKGIDIMPPPGVAAMARYADVPVSHYTGVPNISIPVYTVSEGPLSLPVSLSYHAGGIKVGEPVSWAGMGWNLNAGGMIARTVRGLPDEVKDIGYMDADLSNPTSNPDTTIDKNGFLAGQGLLDTEPDILGIITTEYLGVFGKMYGGYGGR